MLPWLVGGLVLAGGAALAAWLLRRRKSRNSGDDYGGSSSGSSSGGESSRLSDEEIRKRAEQAAREAARRREQKLQRADDAVREILKGDEDIAKLAMELAGEHDGTPRQALQDDAMIRRIAQSLSGDMRNILSFANRTHVQLDTIDLNKSRDVEQRSYPADKFEIERMDGSSEFSDILPEELAGEDDIFYAQLRDESFNVIRHYEEVEKLKRLYALVDVSGSMRESMSGGTRIQWAAGVMLRLLMRAKAGEAELLMRLFGNSAHELHTVTTPEEASRLIDTLVRLRDWDESTNIQQALQTAVSDIDAAESEIDTSDILLISDGESHLDIEWLKRTFGTDKRLHVSMIGKENPILADKSIVASYQVYR